MIVSKAVHFSFNLLKRRVIQGPHSMIEVKKNTQNIVKKAALVSLFVSVLVFAIKFLAFFVSRSEAVFSDALESTLNIIAALFALWSIKESLKPADEDHPYGHGKFESLSAAFEGGLISFAGIIIIMKAAYALFTGVKLEQLGLGVILLVCAGLINGGLSIYLISQGKRHNSQALLASGKHVLSDFYTSVGAFFALVVVYFTAWNLIDPIVALVIGAQLSWMGVKVFRDAQGVLTDEHDKDLIEKCGKIFTQVAFPGIIRIHHTRIMRSGRFHHIDTHIVVPEYWNVEEAHRYTDEFERRVITEYPFDAELHIHIDPCLKNYCQICDVKNCTIRQKEFMKKLPFTYEELVSVDEH